MGRLQEQDRLGPMVDDRLVPTVVPTAKFLKKNALSWFLNPENQDYFAPEMMTVSPQEITGFQEAATDLYRLAMTAADQIAARGWWEQAGIPEPAIPLVRYSLQEERGLHILGRFDFAGGLGLAPLKMLEFNADTCSLLPETDLVQSWQKEKLSYRYRKYGQFNELMPEMVRHFRRILEQYPEKEPALLLSSMGHEEDWLNLDVVALAAKTAGFTDVQQMVLDKVIFSAEEGIFIEIGPENYRRYDFWFKMIPWEFIAYEEPELMGLLSEIVQKGLAVVLNPAFTMLLQSKAIMKFMYDLEPHHPHLLPTSLVRSQLDARNFVRKPIYGRTGDNVSMYLGGNLPEASNEGDYGHFPPVFQALADLDKDEDGDIYQPSIYWSGKPSALCFRRQDDLLIDDDAEFLGHIITP